MAIRQISTGNYLRVVHPVNSNTFAQEVDGVNPEELYDASVRVLVNIVIYKNQQEANNPNSEYKERFTDRYFNHELNVPEEEGMTAEQRQRKMGYLLLLESGEFSGEDYENC